MGEFEWMKERKYCQNYSKLFLPDYDHVLILLKAEVKSSGISSFRIFWLTFPGPYSSRQQQQQHRTELNQNLNDFSR